MPRGRSTSTPGSCHVRPPTGSSALATTAARCRRRGSPRPSCCCTPGSEGELRLPLTVRNAEMRSHAGEVSLPGGASEERDPSREATAVREAFEEIGVDAGAVTILGALDDVWIPVTNFEIRPFVGALAAQPEMSPQSDEVALIVELPVRDLMHEGAITDEIVHGPGWTLRVGGYRASGQLVWGATARTLAMFATVLRGLDA
jgi:8-oxo-dGTP pyrophosphatase MutT (NUDIX family)